MPTILLVEDDLNLLHAMETLLRGAGYRVCTAPNGALALRSARTVRPDVVVSDWMMPGMDGVALVRALKSEPQFADIPVVMTSAIASPPAVPVHGFLRKPFAVPKLLEMVGRALKH